MIAEPHSHGMKRLLGVLLLAVGVAGCTNPGPGRSPAPGATAANLTVRTVKASGHRLLLEVHVYPRKPLGEAHLTVSGQGIRVSPQVFDFHNLTPPPSPDTSHSPPNPPPLPRTIIRIFHIDAPAQPPSVLKVRLWWHTGSTSIDVSWPQQRS